MRKIKVIMADHLTVITSFLRLQGHQKSLLESIPRDKTQGRYSIIGIDPVHEIECFGTRVIIDGLEQESLDPLQTIETFVVKNNEEQGELIFQGGAIGYVGYDVFALYEELGTMPPDELGIADCHFYVYESFVIFDHLNERLTLVQDNAYSNRTEAELTEGLRVMEAQLNTPVTEEQRSINIGKLAYKSNCTKKEYMEMVRQGKQLIAAGDLFQVVPSQRLSAPFPYDSFDYYRKLRISNPSSYLYYIDFGETTIIGSSPESLVSVKQHVVLTNPIAGTRKRGTTVEEDVMLTEELLNDPKELAEHQMLVDLGRNDIGRIAEIGTVTVPVYMVIEKYRFVMHIVSVVEGKLRKELSSMAALKATLPAGTVSGAPKIRACQRIYQLEKVKRNVYAGAVGYLSQNDQLDFAIGIRTMVLHQGIAHVQAGAGIVADSDPATEYEETLQKARALLEVGN